MKHLISTKSITTMALALCALAAVSSAQAHSDMYFSVGVQVPGLYVQSAPVHGQARPVYTPAPRHDGRFDERRRYDGQHWQHRSPYGDHGVANIHDAGRSRHQWYQARVYGPYGDLDRDGIINLYDRDRDGDGVRNRYDRMPDHSNRR